MRLGRSGDGGDELAHSGLRAFCCSFHKATTRRDANSFSSFSVTFLEFES